MDEDDYIVVAVEELLTYKSKRNSKTEKENQLKYIN